MTSEANASEPLLEKLQQILAMLVKGEFVEGMEKFYAEDAINEESTGVIIRGKQAISRMRKKSSNR